MIGVEVIRRALARIPETLLLMVGVPDYERYVAHRRTHHPNEPVMDYASFFRERQASRYGKGTSRCC